MREPLSHASWLPTPPDNEPLCTPGPPHSGRGRREICFFRASPAPFLTICSARALAVWSGGDPISAADSEDASAGDGWNRTLFDFALLGGLLLRLPAGGRVDIGTGGRIRDRHQMRLGAPSLRQVTSARQIDGL